MRNQRHSIVKTQAYFLSELMSVSLSTCRSQALLRDMYLKASKEATVARMSQQGEGVR